MRLDILFIKYLLHYLFYSAINKNMIIISGRRTNYKYMYVFVSTQTMLYYIDDRYDCAFIQMELFCFRYKIIFQTKKKPNLL